MAERDKTNQEGATDLNGLQDFLVSVDKSEFQTQVEPEVTLDLGEQVNPDVKKEEASEEQNKVEEGKGNTPEPEKATETSKKEEPKVDSPKVDQSDSYYGKLAQKFLSKGKWQDAEIEKEDGTKIKLSELDTIDEDTFFAIEESQSKFSEDDIKTNYIRKDAFDENKLKIIEILKEGGDIKDIFATPEEAKRPFEGVDLEDSNIQKNIFFNYLTKVQKLNPEDAKVVLAGHDKRGELDGKVKEIVGGYQSDYDNKLTQKLESIKAEKAEQATKDKEFTKNLQEIYKNYELDEKIAKKLSSLGTKRTSDGDFELDSIYAEKLGNPQEAAELIWFLTDKEGFMKSKMADTKIGTEKSHLRTISLLKDKQRKDDKAASAPQEGMSDFLINVNELKQ